MLVRFRIAIAFFLIIASGVCFGHISSIYRSEAMAGQFPVIEAIISGIVLVIGCVILLIHEINIERQKK